MRPVFDLIRRFLLTLALIVAAMPVKAGEPDCAPVRPTCAMPCCASKPVDKMMCATPAHVFKSNCPCELRPGPAVAPLPARAALPTFESQAVASTPPVLPSVASATSWAEPGVFGGDSGPPPDPLYRSDSSRAPPVVRA